jgi:endoglucanase
MRHGTAERPAAKWFGDWSGDITSAVSAYVAAAATAGELPVIVAYDMYDRDCNGASSGGATSLDAYRSCPDLATNLINGS